MADVLLAHSFFLQHDPKQVEKMRPYAPLATLFAASHLRQAGHSVALFDAMLAAEEEFAAALDRLRPRFVVLYEDSFNFLSKMCLEHARTAACRMSRAARDAGATVVAAGADVTDHPRPYLESGVQFALVGEADHTLRELIDALRAGQPAEEISGVAVADPLAPGGVRRTASRPLERHPDTFPLPAWDLIDAERYRAAWRQAHGFYSVNLVTTRGCPFHCNWCAKPIWGRRYAMRSPGNVAEEMVLVRRTLAPDHVWFADDIFGLQPKWVAEFGREVEARGVRIPFTIQSRADLMTGVAVEGLSRAGCAEVWLGAESGSQKILDAMDKGIRVAEIVAATRRLQDAGIRACWFLQFGYPGETWDDILATIELMRGALPDDVGVSVSYPLPGTRFHDMVAAELGDKTHWADSNDLAMMFQGTYQTPFYRKLREVVHRELVCRKAGAADAAELRRLNADWQELERLEAACRSAAPTAVHKPYDCLPAPDLSRTWN
ncbi:MAG TPA: radical SAM protein [Thermoanaerobaculia bacterium]|nr:radical SAM protein [Thermoanaerobaculia bacterium]